MHDARSNAMRARINHNFYYLNRPLFCANVFVKSLFFYFNEILATRVGWIFFSHLSAELLKCLLFKFLKLQKTETVCN